MGYGVGWDAGSTADDVLEEEVSSSAGATSGAAAPGDVPFSTLPDAALRFPLRRFLFLRPLSVR
jgi:hypothetical protein